MTSLSSVTRGNILAYGGLATPLAMIGYPIAIWLIPFYSEVVGIPLYIIANILLIARFTDVITDPILGQLGDSTRTPIGRRKPWIILGVPLMMLAIYKLFIPGTEVSIAYFVIWMMLMYLGSTIIGIPYGAWGAEISPDYHQRSRVVGGREGWTLIGLLISALIPLAIEVSGQGISFSDSIKRMLAAIFIFQDFSTSGKMTDILASMGLGIVILLPIFAGLALWKVPDPMPKVEKKIPLVEGLKYAAENPLLIRISYARYFIAGLIGIPFWLWLGKTLGKHKAFCITLVGTGTVSFLCFFLERGDFNQFHALFLIKGFCFGGLQFLPASMLADVVDLDSLKTGGRRAGTFFALNGMIAKVSAMIAVWAAAILVAFSGFVPGTENTDSAMLALRIYYCLGCAAFFVPALFLTWFYPLTKEKHKELRAQLESQNAKTEVTSAD